MSKVKLQVVEIGPLDAYGKNRYGSTDTLRPGDVIEFDRMPNFETWDIDPNWPSNGFDYTEDLCPGTNLRTGDSRTWCFHAIKFEKA
jgi:hypothetical protein